MASPTAIKPKIAIIRAAQLNRMPWLVHGFSTRAGGFSRAYRKGDLNLGFTKEDSRRTVERNREAFLHELGVAHPGRKRSSWGENGGFPWPFLTLRQIHSDIIHLVDSLPEETPAGDGLITATPNLLLAIQTADCLPIILADSKTRAIGVFHAGWRGTVKRIVEKGAGEMFRCFGSRPRDIHAAVGPGIRGCCYEVGEEVRSQFESQFEYGSDLFREVKESDAVREKYPLLFLTARAPGHGELPPKLFLDLVEANRRQLMAAGIPAKNIEACEMCTNCGNDLLFSYRAEKGKTGRQMGVAAIRA